MALPKDPVMLLCKHTASGQLFRIEGACGSI